ncbi:hypothetical protein A3B21_01415 [Candidatus Uhrbacteria bacterium RIFCSPLOWO2_01_FULL_47_24]|uniref:CopY family transcriptional regulator n=1 Tax=Candidatus Uhrbacteria bacterium RIFCSPLOWO2_01_FULL_47_24 TaxID=1802401 RepID=A0A1F7UNT2_9BACT|nr:MAG: hypothetical protein A3D58_02790 [Candidatus Uhrbacteria bacterium RIFCSPHIGHO2_02_FULL_46_47]OGL76710.1 MAG: hypothetical protein A3F52_00415 [Candidatus Uhrbacteria bacterium RIFCSPHIGHO2_12_FULL_47_11]OGL79936.1 MAG: hypothetical protein A3B21_01415 [Candidatus Uhrbacteria bacterium RIFCSPLOWO2_01_FULL_47_24]OGL84193.1 MAG: hypothetical protein A3J03_02010 [Candidatus Uhrbacteria bacterium RIFCSPLOWO2_02_FULL_46_25]OGL93343.1 MAG: hypothetical protein A3H11_02475 [Candidatus Uhrbacte
MNRIAVQKKGKVLGDLEETIMNALWKLGTGTVRDVLAIVERTRDAAYTTVMTVMSRMTEKGYLCRKELGNGSFEYKPCHSREEFYAKTSRMLFSQLIRSAGPVAVAQFVDALEEIDPKQLAILKERLKRKK